MTENWRDDSLLEEVRPSLLLETISYLMKCRHGSAPAVLTKREINGAGAG